MKKIMALSLFVLMLSCTSDKTETVTVKNKYSVELPSFLSEAKGLHDMASLQYQNAFKEFYIVIIDEPKEEFANAAKATTEFTPDFNGYYQILRGSLKASIKNGVFTDTKDTQINGLKAKTFTLTGKADEIPVFYDIAYVEGNDRFYQIVTWTIESSKEKFKEPMDKIIASFKEIGSGKSSDRSLK